MKVTTLIAAAAFAAFALTAVVAQADERDGIDDTPSGLAMATDLLIVRPVGLVMTVLGVGLFIVQMPITLISNGPMSAPAEKLVAEPARFTFRRPLGQMD